MKSPASGPCLFLSRQGNKQRLGAETSRTMLEKESPKFLALASSTEARVPESWWRLALITTPRDQCPLSVPPLPTRNAGTRDFIKSTDVCPVCYYDSPRSL